MQGQNGISCCFVNKKEERNTFGLVYQYKWKKTSESKFLSKRSGYKGFYLAKIIN